MASDDLALEEFSALSDLPAVDDAGEKTAADLATVFDVPVNISAVLGKSHMSVAQLLKLNKGSVLELDRKVGEAIDIFVNNRLDRARGGRPRGGAPRRDDDRDHQERPFGRLKQCRAGIAQQERRRPTLEIRGEEPCGSSSSDRLERRTRLPRSKIAMSRTARQGDPCRTGWRSGVSSRCCGAKGADLVMIDCGPADPPNSIDRATPTSASRTPVVACGVATDARKAAVAAIQAGCQANTFPLPPDRGTDRRRVVRRSPRTKRAFDLGVIASMERRGASSPSRSHGRKPRC